MSHLINDIQKSRSPRELTDYVEQVRIAAKADNEERKNGQLKRGNYKTFFDEIIPLAKFAAHAYPADYLVTPVLGSQGYDAEVRDKTGALVERVEIANPINGVAVAQAGRALAGIGSGGFRIVDPIAELEELFPIIASTARNKAVKDYTDCSIVFNIAACPPFSGFETHHEEQIVRIKKRLAEIAFKAKRVFVICPSGSVDRVDL